MYLRSDIEAFFATASSEHHFGGTPSGWRFWRHALPQLVLNPGLMAVALYRASNWCVRHNLMIGARLVDRINHALTGCELLGEAEFGPGLLVQHPVGVTISREVKVGSGARIYGSGCSIGWQDIDRPPSEQQIVIGDNLVLSQGARLYGPVTVGDNVRLGPNTLIIGDDLPDGAVVVNTGRSQRVLRLNAAEPADQ
jgi:serine O-acetyltransferase